MSEHLSILIKISLNSAPKDPIEVIDSANWLGAVRYFVLYWLSYIKIHFLQSEIQYYIYISCHGAIVLGK